MHRCPYKYAQQTTPPSPLPTYLPKPHSQQCKHNLALHDSNPNSKHPTHEFRLLPFTAISVCCQCVRAYSCTPLNTTAHADASNNRKVCSTCILFSHLQECWVNATALKVKWCCCCACVMWYTEGVELLLKEIHQVLAFLKWYRDQWNKYAFHVCWSTDGATHFPTTLPPHGKTAAFAEGLKVYALCQASVCPHLFNTFTQQWHDIPTFIAIADHGLADEEVVVDNAA